MEPWGVLGCAVAGALVLGPWLARTAARLTARDPRATATSGTTVLATALLAGGLAGAVLLGGLRPATIALAWAAGAAVVLALVDLAAHRLPDRVLAPALGVCGAALLADAAVEGAWPALARAVTAGAATLVVSGGVRLAAPPALGLGDVKLLGLLGLVLGWAGWGVLLAGLFLGLLTGALASVVLVATRRAGWRDTVPFGPPLLAGAVLALAIGGIPPG
ncbi:prepilin peptidase [Blastococcus xanthinilyticus]|uniref:Leader peptidase (Prepilin peptidase)/N-methyltransferase n=1 Tax=Blastococcus xanthinilyticus TaxID=1564164 RepID=A0A5S5CS64_9ACTN|nr:prepilin peptidase [Blastococcus xanthinilyticus]TYP84979.1 leader peptidase (prepilin peptidase)/N-methyltransferase [Blastococcus xanthinilyticus]